MRYTGIWEDQRQAQRQGMKKKNLFSLFLSPLYEVWLCVCGRVLHFFFLSHNLFTCSCQIYCGNKFHIFLLLKAPNPLSLLLSCMLSTVMYLAQPPSLHYVCCCNHLICRLWSHKHCLWWSQSQEFIMMRHDVHDWIKNHSLTNQSVAQLHRLPLSGGAGVHFVVSDFPWPSSQPAL